LRHSFTRTSMSPLSSSEYGLLCTYSTTSSRTSSRVNTAPTMLNSLIIREITSSASLVVLILFRIPSVRLLMFLSPLPSHRIRDRPPQRSPQYRQTCHCPTHYCSSVRRRGAQTSVLVRPSVALPCLSILTLCNVLQFLLLTVTQRPVPRAQAHHCPRSVIRSQRVILTQFVSELSNRATHIRLGAPVVGSHSNVTSH